MNPGKLQTRHAGRSVGKSRLRFWIIAFALVALTFSSVAAQGPAPLVRVGLGPEDDSKPLVYAARAGLFARAGLDVELEDLPGGAVVGAALAGGSLEIGKGSPVSVITAFAKGLPFTVIGGSAWYTRETRPSGLIVAAKSDVTDAHDLIGQTLGAVTLQDLGTLATYAWLTQNGVDWKSVKFIEMPTSRALAAMQTNLIVGMPVYEPTLTADLATGQARVLGYPWDAIGSRFSMGVLFANESWVDSHRDVVDRFLHVMQQADAYVMAHENETVPLLAQFGGADPAVLVNIHHPERGAAIGPSDLQPVIDILARYGVIPQAFPAQEMICSCALRK